MKTVQEFETFVARNAVKLHTRSVEGTSLALAGEVGELLGEIKKEIDHNFTTGGPDPIALEMGDVLYYLAHLAFLRGYCLEDLMEINMDKLKKRGMK